VFQALDAIAYFQFLASLIQGVFLAGLCCNGLYPFGAKAFVVNLFARFATNVCETLSDCSACSYSIVGMAFSSREAVGVLAQGVCDESHFREIDSAIRGAHAYCGICAIYNHIYRKVDASWTRAERTHCRHSHRHIGLLS
jgi:hypothetical protein